MKEKSSPSVLLLVIPIFSLALTFNSLGNKKETEDAPVRKAAVAGGFYPEDKATLEVTVDTLLHQADPPVIKEPIRAIMVPHAGYLYSGAIAAYAYKTLEGRDIRTVILLGNSHTEGFDGISVYKEGAFETPLGQVAIDKELARKIIVADPKIMDRPSAHERDHILEVQLPFLQRVLKDFKIVPIVFGSDDPKLAEILTEALKKNIDDKTLIIASTDMSHYPSYENATSADHETLQAITTGQAETFDTVIKELTAKGIPNTDTFLCGVSAVRTVLLLTQALGPTTPIYLKYANSGDVSEDKSRVVGYGAIAFVARQSTTPATLPSNAQQQKPLQDEHSLTAQEKDELLEIARLTVESYIKNGKVPEFSPVSPGLKRSLGAFVTLKENGELRGCIGHFEPSEPLYKLVQQMGIAAATQDPRFRPVSANELGKLAYEISVLSPLRNIKSTGEIELGKHGVAILKGDHHGVFLPQVATETGWDKARFLSELCTQKAGLSADCWKDADVTLRVFTAEVFPEEKN